MVNARAVVVPGVFENLIGREAFVGVEAHELTNETLGSTGDGVRNDEVHLADLGEDFNRLTIAERISSNQHRVQHDAQHPQVGLLRGVGWRTAVLYDFRTHVGWTHL